MFVHLAIIYRPGDSFSIPADARWMQGDFWIKRVNVF